MNEEILEEVQPHQNETREAAEVRPGLTAPIHDQAGNMSPQNDLSTLDKTIVAVLQLMRTARHPHQDALWPIYKDILTIARNELIETDPTNHRLVTIDKILGLSLVRVIEKYVFQYNNGNFYNSTFIKSDNKIENALLLHELTDEWVAYAKDKGHIRKVRITYEIIG